MRAEVYSKRIVQRLKAIFPEKTFFLPKKHFAFGRLSAESNSTLDGIVRWRYHVAPMVRLNDGKLYILDPALSADPIEKEKWYGLMKANTSIPGLKAKITGYITCESATYHAGSSCFQPMQVDSNYLEAHTQGYLAE